MQATNLKRITRYFTRCASAISSTLTATSARNTLLAGRQGLHRWSGPVRLACCLLVLWGAIGAAADAQYQPQYKNLDQPSGEHGAPARGPFYLSIGYVLPADPQAAGEARSIASRCLDTYAMSSHGCSAGTPDPDCSRRVEISYRNCINGGAHGLTYWIAVKSSDDQYLLPLVPASADQAVDPGLNQQWGHVDQSERFSYARANQLARAGDDCRRSKCGQGEVQFCQPAAHPSPDGDCGRGAQRSHRIELRCVAARIARVHCRVDGYAGCQLADGQQCSVSRLGIGVEGRGDD